MALSQKDIKLLWGRAGSRCAICQCELSHDQESKDGAFVVGEQAHIVGEKEEAPRGESSLSLEDRNTYHNIILLCPTHHTEIDKNEADWPIERLYQVKSKHELWVRESLSSVQDLSARAEDLIVSSSIDAIVSMLRLDEWTAWTSFALAPDSSWPEDLPEDIFKCLEKLIAAIWPDRFSELKAASQHFVRSTHKAAETFLQHAELKNGRWRLIRFYKQGWNENYDADLQRFKEWQMECTQTIHEATKAANWFADVVRRDVNPLFFAEGGRFLLSEGPFMDGTFKSFVLTYQPEEIDLILNPQESNGEQVGAVQPATAPESTAEDNKNPKPESEVRSQ